MRSIARTAARPGRSIALAIALMAGTAVVGTAIEAPAHAQRDKKKEKASKPSYSKGFIAAYSPVNEMTKAESPDYAAIKAALPQVEAAVENEDDKFVFGNLNYIIGRDSNDMALQRKGVGLMLESGRTPAENVAQYTFLAGQLAYQEEDWAAARDFIKRAVDLGYNANDPEAIIAETYFNEGQHAAGLTYLGEIIAAKQAAGETVDEAWLRRGITVAYQNDVADQAINYSRMYAEMYPSQDSWGDAISIQRNLVDYDNQTSLDLLRLAKRVDAMRNARDYIDYIEFADFRRLPGEVKVIAEEGIQSGMLESGDVYVAEALNGARSRIASDQAELPSLERDARNGSSLPTVMAAGDAFLSYGQPAKAEEFYTKALTLPGVERDRMLTRLGIAQADQGKYAEAAETFAKIQTGPRANIARLWEIYVAQESEAAGG
ncbi:hypothetical protein [Erythrobacter litoralis]|uniref:Tetratricopeptide repeat protein n=1 Tax=Erythrobacter litoralis (strain HTCC2594) TaxID=314225 RepID=Q2NAD2_ERYLH|nr:hypothetical protein [Erythrobacter litoralis]ABC63359.1 hypothetical protein ELI_06335 [Erythrobacter litoralis HTCC2594]